jgi:OFA family oxalate/formate antiporter-like MFS transporter
MQGGRLPTLARTKCTTLASHTPEAVAATSGSPRRAARSPQGWLVTFAAAGTGLVLGILYIWSVLKAGIPASWGWSHADMALPYSVMCLAFAVTMVPAGWLQDRRGPRLVILLGGLLAGLGCIVCGLGGSSLAAYVVGFGVLTGSGVGFGYSATTPAAVKWFPPERTGMIAGIVVAGFALAPLLLAPLTAWLLTAFQTTVSGGVDKGVSATMIVLGVVVWLVVGSLALLIHNPPKGYLASLARDRPGHPRSPVGNEYGPRQMLRTIHFWLLFAMFFFGAAAGLMFISVASDLGRAALGSWAFLAVIALAAGNACGRILAGAASDRLGRPWTLFAEFVCQALVVAALYMLSGRGGAGAILVVVVLLGFNYGANLALFPAACKDYFGIGSFGLNYGCLFVAFGAAGLIMPYANGWITDASGSSNLSYAVVIGLMAAGAVLAQVSRYLGPPRVFAIAPASLGMGVE